MGLKASGLASGKNLLEQGSSASTELENGESCKVCHLLLLMQVEEEEQKAF